MFDRQASAVQAGHAPLMLPTALGRWRRISRSLAHPLVRRAGTRVIGLLLVLVAWAAARAMIGLVAARHPATPVECLLAGVAFVGASYGSALLVLGDHMFDPVEVAPRWCRYAA